MSNLEQIQQLREMTGSGIMDCKQALKENNFDMDKALDYLREKGKAKAAKKASREAAEGIIYSYIHPGSRIGVLIELNCETDFVARTDDFKNLAKEIAMQVAATEPGWLSRDEVSEDAISREKEIIKKQLAEQGKPAEMIDKITEGKMNRFYSENCLLEMAYIRDDKKKVKDIISEAIGKIGENIQLARFIRFEIGK